MDIINWFKKPYFFLNSTKYNFILCFGVGLFLFTFLYILEPFGISVIKVNKVNYLLGLSFVTFINMIIFLIILPKIFKKIFKNETWTVGKNLIFFIIITFFISFGNWYFNHIMQYTEYMKSLSFKSFIIYTYSISIFPTLFYTYFSERINRLYREKTSLELMKLKEKKKIIRINKEVTIFGENQKEFICFNIDNLIYITSQGNYASFFIKKENEVIKEEIIRKTLTKIEDELKEFKKIVRCHKSFIVNFNYIAAIKGNARGYLLKSEFISFDIPVSRRIKKQDLEKIIQ